MKHCVPMRWFRNHGPLTLQTSYIFWDRVMQLIWGNYVLISILGNLSDMITFQESLNLRNFIKFYLFVLENVE